MRKHRTYKRELARTRQDALVRLYKNNIGRHGCLTSAQRRAILGLANEYGTTPADFWHNVKRYAQNALLDLEFLVRIGDNTLIKELFEPVDKDECLNIRICVEPRYQEDFDRKNYPKIDGMHRRTDLKFIVDGILAREPLVNDWRDTFAKDLLNSCLVYFTKKPEFRSNLHRRLFQELSDSITVPSSSSSSERTMAEHDVNSITG